MATLFVWHIAQKHNHKPLSSHTTMSKHTPRTHTSTYLSRHLTKVVDECNGGLLLNRIFNLVNVLAQVKETTQCGWPIPIPHHVGCPFPYHTTLCGGGPFPYHATLDQWGGPFPYHILLHHTKMHTYSVYMYRDNTSNGLH